MMNTQAAALRTGMGVEIPLQHVKINVQLEDLVSNVSVKQTYTNNELVNIEAVYTFPLPSDAVLLHLTVEIGDRKLEGIIVGKSKAEKEYEEAITDGDSAIMLEQTGSGLYTMNIGNLEVDETAIISFTYGTLNKWKGENLRFLLPTTLAPRYGEPEQVGLQHHQIPQSSILVENKFSLSMRVSGALVDAEINCPSHKVKIQQQDGQTLLTLENEQDFMDKDFVILFKPKTEQTSTALSCQDDKLHLVMASFNPKFKAENNDIAHSVNIVVDCSGSMTGVSIQQAKIALERILDGLRPQDHFNIIAFGSHTITLFKGQRVASKKYLKKALKFIHKLDADLGGTEMIQALDAAYLSRGEAPFTQEDILLITDGQIWESERIIQEAVHSHKRVFTVGVGSAVSEAFLTELADKSGGACELVSPNEKMADNIVRHYQRMHTPRAEEITINWGATPERQFPKTIKSVFSEDTLHIFGWFKKTLNNSVKLELLSNDTQYHFETSIREIDANKAIADELPRIAMANVISDSKDSESELLALQYQLVSTWTNYLVIDKRDDNKRSKMLPELRQVKHMILDTSYESLLIDADFDRPMIMRSDKSVHKNMQNTADIEYIDIDIDIDMDMDMDMDMDLDLDLDLDLPAFLRRQNDGDLGKKYIININSCSGIDILDLITIDDLENLLGINSLDDLKQLSAQFSIDERIILFVYLNTISSKYESRIHKQQKRAIKKGYKLYAQNNPKLAELIIAIEKLF